MYIITNSKIEQNKKVRMLIIANAFPIAKILDAESKIGSLPVTLRRMVRMMNKNLSAIIAFINTSFLASYWL